MIAIDLTAEALQSLIWTAALVFLRVGAAVAVLPGLGERMIPMRIRLAVALGLTVLVAPLVAPSLPPLSPTLGDLALALLTETVTGLFFGLLLRLFVFSIQTAGAIAAQSTSLSHLVGNSGVDPLPAIGHILTISALALLFATGFHVKAVSYLAGTYQLIPALTVPSPSAIAQSGRDEVAASFARAFSLAAPFVVLSVLYNLTLGVINKAMPQLMVAFVGAPVITLGSIALLFVAAPVMLVTWLNAVETFLAAPIR